MVTINLEKEDLERMRGDIRILEDVYSDTRDIGPKETINRYVDVVGVDRAKTTIASLINMIAWDGRITQKVREWAKNEPSALRENEKNRYWLHVYIHPTHIDQMADELRLFFIKNLGSENE